MIYAATFIPSDTSGFISEINYMSTYIRQLFISRSTVAAVSVSVADREFQLNASVLI
jgi:hypothetical protein